VIQVPELRRLAVRADHERRGGTSEYRTGWRHLARVLNPDSLIFVCN
jgi:hypothetical protein